MQKHKWYNEIVAWASGAEIEYYDSGVNNWRDKTFPDWFENYQYRIKPQPVEPQYIKVYGYLENQNICFQQQIGMPYIGKIKLEDDN